MALAAGQVPEQQAIDGPRGQLASLRAAAGAGDMVEQPGDLGGREVRVEDQAGAFGDPGTAVAVFFAERGGPAVLPDQGWADRSACLAVPDHSRLTLVGQPDRGDPTGVESRFGQRSLHLRSDRGHQGAGIMLDPARLGIGGKDLGLGLTDREQTTIVDDGPSAGGSLVDRQQVVACHGRWPPVRLGRRV